MMCIYPFIFLSFINFFQENIVVIKHTKETIQFRTSDSTIDASVSDPLNLDADPDPLPE